MTGEVDALKPGAGKVPSCDPDNFGFNGSAGSTLHRTFTYVSRKHSLVQVLRPGYFDAARDYGIGVWDLISCTIGDDPGTASEVDLRVIDMGHSAADPVVVAKGDVRHFVPARHDGSLGEAEAPKRGKAA